MSDLTLSPIGLEETLQTPITTNDEFLAAIFQHLAEPHRPFVLGFGGKPKDRKAWGGDAWRIARGNIDNPALNWYFSLAVYTPTDDGYHRRERDCAAVYGVMLDDLGTKAKPLDCLDACPPSYVIETSPGNFQAGYLFTQPETDFARIKALNQSMVDAGLCDPGAKSPATRYGRLPFASNGKTDPAFSCRLMEWHPERRYTIDQIFEGLQLRPAQSVRPPRGASKTAAIDRNGEGDIYLPRMAENAVLAALRQRGLYKQPLGDGKHDITCPWVREHTDSIDHGSAYFEPSDLFPVGGFKCQHGHGDKYRLGALLQHLGVTFTEAKHRPTIRVALGELNRVVDAAEQQLAASGRHYQRGGLIVNVVTDPGTYGTVIKPVSANALTRALSACAIWERYDARAMAFVVTDPPPRHVNVLFDSETYQHLPVLHGIARQPYLRQDGSLMAAAGFDPASGMFGVFDERAFHVPDSPDREMAESALNELRALLTEFSFAKPHDMAAAIAMMLTAAIRPALPVAPMGHVKAPQIASGKSFLCQLIAAFAGPTKPAAYSFPSNEEECTKLLLSALLESPAVVMFDNMTTDLIPYKSLCSALTEEHLTGRILGVSKMATVGTKALFLSSGNNVDAIRDMARRVVTIMLDPACETPATRRFSGDPVTTVLRDRPKFVAWALTIVRAYLTAGSPAQELQALGSYNEWTRLVRAPLVWLGLPDPATSVFASMTEDPDRETLGRLLAAWHKEYRDSPTTVRTVVERAGVWDNADDTDELNDILREIADERGRINRKRLGRWIARHQGRIVNGLKFERDTSSGGVVRWKVVVMGVSGVTSGQHGESVSTTNAHDVDSQPGVWQPLAEKCMAKVGDRKSVEFDALVADMARLYMTQEGRPTPERYGDYAKQAIESLSARDILSIEGTQVLHGILY